MTVSSTVMPSPSSLITLGSTPSAPTHFKGLRFLKRALIWSSSNTGTSPAPWTLTLGAMTLKAEAREALGNSAFTQGMAIKSPVTEGSYFYLYFSAKNSRGSFYCPWTFFAHFSDSWALAFLISFLCAQTMLLLLVLLLVPPLLLVFTSTSCIHILCIDNIIENIIFNFYWHEFYESKFLTARLG